jgi:hypothetical protein
MGFEDLFEFRPVVVLLLVHVEDGDPAVGFFLVFLVGDRKAADCSGRKAIGKGGLALVGEIHDAGYKLDWEDGLLGAKDDSLELSKVGVTDLRHADRRIVPDLFVDPLDVLVSDVGLVVTRLEKVLEEAVELGLGGDDDGL